ncbi:MAG TPA: ABC transporter permease subunit [Acidimicrobiales bacterium]|nr:ABC transporter permease subunit [Acidimicrobiales bacterium]
MTTAVAEDRLPAHAPRRQVPGWVGSVVGIAALIGLWWLLAVTVLSGGKAVPTPAAVVRQIVKDGWHFYGPNLRATVGVAAKGWLWGNLLAVALAMLILIGQVFEGPLLQLGVVSYCLPIVAIGPILVLAFRGDTPRVVLAALAVFYTTLIGMLIGLRSADVTSLDVVRAYGGGRGKQLTKVRLRSSLPSLFAALRIAAPAAVLGAIIGEYLGADRGLGVAMINSEQALEVARTWGIALVAAAVAGLGYGITALVGRLLTPWAPRNK